MTGAEPVPAIFFLSDFGMDDEFVGVVHAVLGRLAPTRPVIDLSHRIPPFDVDAGAAMLVRCAPFLGVGVVLAVVDPGVGTARRGVAIGTPGAAEGPRWLVGPDNGLLMPMAADLGGADRAVLLDPERLAPGGTGPAPSVGTFDGRDLFAPAAAHLAMGGAAETMGTPVDPTSLVTLAPSPPVDGDRVEELPAGSMLAATVTWIDRFGNVQLRLPPAALEAIGLSLGETAYVTVEGAHVTVEGEWREGRSSGGGMPQATEQSVPCRRVRAFADLDKGECGLLLDANGRIALVLNRASAALHLGIRAPGHTVRISTRNAGHA